MFDRLRMNVSLKLIGAAAFVMPNGAARNWFLRGLLMGARCAVEEENKKSLLSSVEFFFADKADNPEQGK